MLFIYNIMLFILNIMLGLYNLMLDGYNFMVFKLLGRFINKKQILLRITIMVIIKVSNPSSKDL